MLRSQVQRGLLVPGTTDDALDELFSLPVEEVTGADEALYRKVSDRGYVRLLRIDSGS